MKKRRITANDLAMHLGINVRHVRKLIRAGMPGTSIAAARKWREENIAGGSDGTAGLNELRGSLIEARRRLADLEYKERSRRLLPADEVRALLVDCATVLRSQHLQVSQSIRARHPGVEPAVIASIDEFNRRALTVLVDSVRRMMASEEAQAAND